MPCAFRILMFLGYLAFPDGVLREKKTLGNSSWLGRDNKLADWGSLAPPSCQVELGQAQVMQQLGEV